MNSEETMLERIRVDLTETLGTDKPLNAPSVLADMGWLWCMARNYIRQLAREKSRIGPRIWRGHSSTRTKHWCWVDDERGGHHWRHFDNAHIYDGNFFVWGDGPKPPPIADGDPVHVCTTEFWELAEAKEVTDG